MLSRLLSLLFILLLPAWAVAQTTTSSMSGIVKTSTGEPLVGASVTAIHTPTGTSYKTQTRAGGRFELNNMNPGGPYTVSSTFVGYATDNRTDIYLELGETAKIDIQMTAQSGELSGVTVTTSREAVRSGSETVIGRDKMENLPTVGRTLTDYLRATPQMKVSSGGQISSEGAMSFAGQNVRYNSFYVDGAVNNDQFGLAYSGTNGGQSGIAPLSIDAIDQFQVSISPYNASLGNFTGAAINAITKSGTNNIRGSAYYIFRNEKLAGKTPTGPKEAATRIPDFLNRTYGVTLGGPIVKNKVFYFLSAELQRDETPSLFTLESYQGNTKDPVVIQKLVDTIAARSGGFNVGGYTNNRNRTEADRLTAKIDWNLTDKHKLAASYRFTKGDRIVPLDNGPTLLRFETNGYRFPTKTHSASVEVKSIVGRSSSNRLLLTLTDVEDDRGPLGGRVIPVVQIQDGAGTINFGTEQSSTFNYLKQATYNLVDQFRFSLGKHNLMVGAEAEYYQVYNSFIQNTAGNYRYDNIDSFFLNRRPNQYIVNFPRRGNDEKNSGSAADFNIFKAAAFINNEIRATTNFTLTLGARIDYYKFLTTPIADTPFVNNTALPKFAQYYNLKGAQAGVSPKVPVELSPRVGFTYRLPGENVVFRGGFGWFAGRIPMVWPSAIYNNNGLVQGGYTLNASQNAALREKVKYRTTAYTPEEIGLSLPDAKGTLVVTSEEFRMPKVFRTNLAVDKRFAKGWSATVDMMVTKNVSDVYYTNINLLPPTLRMATGPDTRTVYPASNTIPIQTTGVANPYQAVYLLSNAEGQRPFSYNITFSVNKTSRTGLNLNLNYTYGQSYVMNDAQSSTPGSQWNGMETVNGRNSLVLSQSDNSMGHRIFGYVSKKFTYLDKKLSTTISLAYNGQSGQPFSYGYSGNAPATRDQGNLTTDLIFVPTQSQLQAMTFLPLTTGGVTYTPDQQKAAFEQFIQNDKYLSSRRGMYAERNGSRVPFSHNLDLKISQGFNVKLANRNYAFEVAYSMFNFTNFLNRDWGRQYVVNFDNYALLGFSYASATNLTPRYTFDPRNVDVFNPYTVYNRFNPNYTARWMSQLEFRVRF